MTTTSIRITLFYCSNALDEEALRILNSRFHNIHINSISLPCSGKVSSLYLLKAIETGSDGVLLVSCRLGNCRSLQGNYRALKRIEDIDELLDETGLGRGAVRFVSMEGDNKTDAVVSAINNMIENFAAQQESQKQSIQDRTP